MLEQDGSPNPQAFGQNSHFSLKRLLKVAAVSLIAALLLLLILYLFGLIGKGGLANTASNIVRNISSTGGNLSKLVNENFSGNYYGQLPERTAPVAPIFTNASINPNTVNQTGSDNVTEEQVENIVNNYITNNYNETSLVGPTGPQGEIGPQGPAGLRGERGPGGGGGSSYTSPLTTEGDLFYHNGTSDDRLARGADGECLTSNTSTIIWGSCGGGSSALSGLTAATALNTIDSGNYAQTWNWNSLSNENAMTLGSTSVSSGTVLNLNVNSTAAASNTQKALNVTTSGANGTATQTTYGGYFSNTHTGTSSTNVAAYFTASGGTNNYAGIFDAGNVGIGTTTPTAKLAVSNASTTIGSELITNGTFTGSATGWTLGDCVAYGSNRITSTENGICGDRSAYTSFPVIAGSTYKITFEVDTSNAGVAIWFDIGPNDWYNEGPYLKGTHTLTYVASSTGTETIYFDSWFYDDSEVWSLDNVSAFQISSITQNALVVTGYDGTNWAHLGGSVNPNLAIGLGSQQSVGLDSYGNTSFGDFTMMSITNAIGNTAFGANALQSLQGGADNVAIGNSAMASSEGASDTVAIGRYALGFSEGSDNVAVGSWSMRKNTTGSHNTALGSFSLHSNTSGWYNVAIGSSNVMYSNIDGDENVAIGNGSLTSNTSGNFNIAMGSYSGAAGTTGENNVAIGQYALHLNSTGSENVAIGRDAGRGYVFGNVPHPFSYNVFVGSGSGYNIQSGQYNTVLGYVSGNGLTDGSNNVLIGHYAGENITTGSNNIVIGNDIWAANATGSDQLNIGAILYGTGLDGTNNSVSSGNLGISTTAPGRKLEINSASGNNLRLTYNDSDGSAATYADLLTTSGGALTVQPSGFVFNLGGGTSRTALRFLEPSGTGTDYVGLQANANVTTSYTWTLPAADASGCIQSNGTGTLSISACGGGSSALSGLTAATALNTIDSGNYAQTWNWNSLSNENAMTLGSTSVSSGTVLNLNVNSTAAASNTQKALNVTTSGANGTATQTTYGGYFSNTHTGTSSTNVAAYFTASGGTNNYAGIFDAGNVGIGTTAPTSKLAVNSTSTVDATELITNGDFTGSATGWTLGSCAVYGSNRVTVTYNGSCTPNLTTTFSSVSGNTYRVTFDVVSTSNDSVNVAFVTSNGTGNNHNGGPYNIGTHSFVYFTTFTGTQTIRFENFSNNNPSSFILDNVSIRQISTVVPTVSGVSHDGFNSLSLGNFRYDVALGVSALRSITTGLRNVAIGDYALKSLTTASGNVAIGANTLQRTTTQGNNTAVGDNALSSNTSNSNVAVGTYALHLNTTGFTNTGVGFGALRFNISGTGNVALGNEAAKFTTGSNNVALGASSLWYNTSGSANVAIGVNAMLGNSGVSSGSSNIAIGESALTNNTANYNVAIGPSVLFNNTTGSENVAIGNLAMQANNIGGANTAIGSGALYNNTSGTYNTALGLSAGYRNTTDQYNVFLGAEAMAQNTTGSYNTAVGAGAGMGAFASGAIERSVFLGYQAGGTDMTSAVNNIMIGYRAGELTTTGDNNILIGYNIRPFTSTDSNKLSIGNLIFGTGIDGETTAISSGNIGIGTIGPDRRLEINSATGNNLRLTYNDSDGSAANYVDQLVSSSGDLTITPSGLDVNFTGSIATVNRDWGVGAAGSVITVGRNNNATTTGAGSVNFQSKAGTAGYVWQDNAGNMRIHTAAPTNANDTAGTVIGTQSSVRSTKQDITDYLDYAEALNMVMDTPLHTFKYKKDVQGYGVNSPLAKARIGYIADEVSAQFMWGNTIDQVSVNGILMASVKQLNNNITAVQNQVSNFQGSGQLNFTGDTPIVIQAHLYLSSDSVGQAKILAGSEEVRISFNKPYQYLPIVTATVRAEITGGYWISEESSTGFTIHLSKAQSKDVSFSWHAFAGQSAKLTVSDGTVLGVSTITTSNPTPPVEIVVPETQNPDENSEPEPLPTEEVEEQAPEETDEPSSPIDDPIVDIQPTQPIN